MKLYRYIFVIVIMAANTDVFAQNILTSTIEWNCNSTFFSDSGTMEDEITKVVTSPTQIVWYDSVGVAKQTLEITGSEGSWTNISNNGSIWFKVNSGEYSGLVQFINSGGATKIRIQVVREDESPIYELTVNTVTSL